MKRKQTSREPVKKRTASVPVSKPLADEPATLSEFKVTTTGLELLVVTLRWDLLFPIVALADQLLSTMWMSFSNTDGMQFSQMDNAHIAFVRLCLKPSAFVRFNCLSDKLSIPFPVTQLVKATKSKHHSKQRQASDLITLQVVAKTLKPDYDDSDPRVLIYHGEPDKFTSCESLQIDWSLPEEDSLIVPDRPNIDYSCVSSLDWKRGLEAALSPKQKADRFESVRLAFDSTSLCINDGVFQRKLTCVNSVSCELYDKAHSRFALRYLLYFARSIWTLDPLVYLRQLEDTPLECQCRIMDRRISNEPIVSLATYTGLLPVLSAIVCNYLYTDDVDGAGRISFYLAPKISDD